MSVTFHGHWNRLLGQLQKSPHWLSDVIQAELEEFGDAVIADIRRQIISNPYTVAESTAARKGTDRAWYEWGDLSESGIEVVIQKRGLGYSAMNAQFSSDPHPRGRGRSYGEIANWLENGTRRQPPRPLIRPKLEAVGKGTDPDFQAFKERVEAAMLDNLT